MRDIIKFLVIAAIAQVALAQKPVKTMANIWDGSIDAEWYWDNLDQKEFTVTTASQLAGFAQLVNGGHNFAGKTINLGANIALNDTADWKNWSQKIGPKTEKSWTAIGSYTNKDNNRPFSGTFNGNGYVVSGVYINNENNFQGLFAYVGPSTMIKNLGIVASFIRGGAAIGGLVGENDGTITNCYTTGNTSGGRDGTIGGLVGSNNGTITDSYAMGNVDSYDGSMYRATGGGLVGRNSGTINNCYATGNVETGSGLVGRNSGTINNCYAKGNVRNGDGLVERNDKDGVITNCYAIGNVETGSGFIGENDGTITNCYATGNASEGWHDRGYRGGAGFVEKNGGTITDSYATGNTNGKTSGVVWSGNASGFVRRNLSRGTITNCYATGNVFGEGDIGGFVGNNLGKIVGCYATGKVQGKNNIGGFAGNNDAYKYSREATIGTITDCYSTGDVFGTANSNVGGFVGNNNAVVERSFKGTKTIKSIITNSYAIGKVSGTTGNNVGGFAGNSKGVINNSYYDRLTSGQVDIEKGEPKSTSQMKLQTTFVDWDFGSIWAIDKKKNNGYPYLRPKTIEDDFRVGEGHSDSVNDDILMDNRDGNKYKIVKISSQTWMAENLNYIAEGSKCYDNKPENCKKYGRLYDWETAMKICPQGWHLPTDEEWGFLTDYIGSSKLKAMRGFAALYGGGCCSQSGNFGGINIYSYWWNASEVEGDVGKAYYTIYDENVRKNTNNKSLFFSVRCVEDE